MYIVKQITNKKRVGTKLILSLTVTYLQRRIFEASKQKQNKTKQMGACLFCSGLLLLLESMSASNARFNASDDGISAGDAAFLADLNATRRVRVMTYNIKQIPNYFGLHAWDQSKRLEKLVAAFEDLPDDALPDAIVFNELLSGAALTAIRSKMADDYPFQTNVIGKDCATAEGWTTLTGNCQVLLPRGGVSIISRHPIEEAHGLVYTDKVKGTWDQLCNKGAVLAKIRLGGGENGNGVDGPVLWLLGTHLQSDEGGADSSSTRERQAAEMTSWVESGQYMGLFDTSPDDLFILAGDLNVEWRAKRHQFEEMKRLTKSRVNYTWDGFGSFSAKTNWLAKAVHYSYSEALDYDDTLDYIGYREDFKHPVYAPTQRVIPLKSATSWYWSYMRGWWDLPSRGRTWYNGYYDDISDHYPVVADFYYDV